MNYLNDLLQQPFVQPISILGNYAQPIRQNTGVGPTPVDFTGIEPQAAQIPGQANVSPIATNVQNSKKTGEYSTTQKLLHSLLGTTFGIGG